MFNIISPDTEIDFVTRQGTFGVVSIVVMTICIASVFTIGPALGIDFKGGTEMIIKFSGDITTGDIHDAFDKAGVPSEQVQRYGTQGDNEFLVQTTKTAVVGPKLESEAEEGDISAEAIVGKVKSVQDKLRASDAWTWTSENPDRLDLRFPEDVDVKQQEIIEAVEELGLRDVEMNDRGAGQYALKFEGLRQKIVRELKSALPDRFEPDKEGLGIKRMETVGPRAGEQLRNSGIWSVVVALFCILVYVAFRFDIRYAPGAVAALIHDITIAVGFFTFTQLEFTLPIIAALLTIVGYSLNDTIVVFDRIRENLELAGTEPLEDISNRSINETLSRTINTSLTTLLAVTSIAVLGGGLIQNFAIALIVGVVVGTYSSVFVATPVMLKMDEFLKDWREEDDAASEAVV